jgi:hypothetical protein
MFELVALIAPVLTVSDAGPVVSAMLRSAESVSALPDMRNVSVSLRTFRACAVALPVKETW